MWRERDTFRDELEALVSVCETSSPFGFLERLEAAAKKARELLNGIPKQWEQFKVCDQQLSTAQKACEDYSRPEGVMGGPCLNCGRSQPEHVRHG